MADRRAIVDAWRAEVDRHRTIPRFSLAEAVERIAAKVGATPTQVWAALMDDAEGSGN